jgi:MarR family transcriptional regulator, organic hydroperoxide resistance regulator
VSIDRRYFSALLKSLIWGEGNFGADDDSEVEKMNSRLRSKSASLARPLAPPRGQRKAPPERELFVGKSGYESFGYLVREANRFFNQMLQILVARHGVTTAQWYFLRALWDNDGLTQAELSNRIGLRTPTTVTALNTLERKGLIKRHRHPTDKRKFNVYLTKRGRQLERLLLSCGKEVNSIATEGLSEEVTEHARSGLHAMCVNLSRRINEQI